MAVYINEKQNLVTIVDLKTGLVERFLTIEEAREEGLIY